MLIEDVLKTCRSFLRHGNDDFIDRFHYTYTVIGLSIYLFFITTKQYYGEPINCVAHGSGELVKFAHSICWMNGTYHFDFVDNEVATQKLILDPLSYKPIRYYQWIIFIIFLQAALFSIPSLIWNAVMFLNGFDMIYVTNKVINNAYLNEYDSSNNWLETQKKIEGVADHVRMSFLSQKKNPMHKKLNLPDYKKDKKITESALLRRRFPNLYTKPVFPLFFPYILIKLISLANVIGHFFLLSYIFNIDYFQFGIKSISNVWNSEYKSMNEFFPKRSLCDFTHFNKWTWNTFTVQCSLPLNLFNEIFYFGFWCWLIFTGTMTLLSIFYWLLMLVKPYRKNIVLNALQIKPSDLQQSYTSAYYLDDASVTTADSFLLEQTGITLMENFELFFDHVCSVDLIFATRLIAINSHKLAMRDILNNLWDQYLDIESIKFKDVKQRPIQAIKRPPPYEKAKASVVKEKAEV